MNPEPNERPASPSAFVPAAVPPAPEAPSLPQMEPERQPAASHLPGWRFWVPLVFQVALIVAIPAQDAYTYATGKTVVLQTVPVDPYDLLRGYSQTLGYNISTKDALQKLPGGDWFQNHTAGEVYVVLEAPTVNGSNPPKPWKPVRVSSDRPTNLPTNQIALKGKYDGFRLVYGLETYYMPEDQRSQLNDTIRQAQQQGERGQQPFVVEAKVDGSGKAVPVSLWIRDQSYQF